MRGLGFRQVYVGLWELRLGLHGVIQAHVGLWGSFGVIWGYLELLRA